MRPAHRWGLAAVATALILATPYAGRLRPVHDSGVSTAGLLAAVRYSALTAYSGTVEVDGRVGLPIGDRFTDLADLFGGETRLRVWWRGSDDWRVDRLLDTGEVDLFHEGLQTVEWDYERGFARASIDQPIRLPRDSDLLPPVVGRDALDGVEAADVTRLSPRRVAGVDAAGLRVEIDDPRSTLRHVDLWVDPETGVALAADVYSDASQPALSTSFTTYSRSVPDDTVTRFHHRRDVPVVQPQLVDITDEAQQFFRVPTPPALDGLVRTSDKSAAVYGSGLTRVLLVPLPPREAGELSYRLKQAGARKVHGQTLLRVGPLGALVSRATRRMPVRWLVTGTVTDETLLAAVSDVYDLSRSR
jgi:hypothetical protein